MSERSGYCFFNFVNLHQISGLIPIYPVRIIFPLCSPTTLYVATITVVLGLQAVFVPIQMLTNGGPNQGSTNLIFFVYQTAFQFFHTGRAAACAIMITLVFGILIALQSIFLEKKVHYEN